MLRQYTGREIRTSLIEALEKIPEGSTIVTVSAGENMPILIALDHDDDRVLAEIPEYSWDGEKLVEIGHL